VLFDRAAAGLSKSSSAIFREIHAGVEIDRFMMVDWAGREPEGRDG
jgi:hypothetical protein